MPLADLDAALASVPSTPTPQLLWRSSLTQTLSSIRKRTTATPATATMPSRKPVRTNFLAPLLCLGSSGFSCAARS